MRSWLRGPGLNLLKGAPSQAEPAEKPNLTLLKLSPDQLELRPQGVLKDAMLSPHLPKELLSLLRGLRPRAGSPEEPGIEDALLSLQLSGPQQRPGG